MDGWVRRRGGGHRKRILVRQGDEGVGQRGMDWIADGGSAKLCPQQHTVHIPKPSIVGWLSFLFVSYIQDGQLENGLPL